MIVVNTSIQAAWCVPMIMLVRRGFYAPNERDDNSHILHVLSECMQSRGITPVHTHKALAFNVPRQHADPARLRWEQRHRSSTT